MNQYNDRSRQWGRGWWSRLKRLKIDLTSTDDDGEVRRFLKKKKGPHFQEKRREEALFVCRGCLSGYWVSARDHVHSLASLPLPLVLTGAL